MKKNKTNPDICHFMVQNAFPVTGQLYTTHLLSLEALLTVIDSIEDHCQAKVINGAPQQDQVETLPAEGKADVSGGTPTGTLTFAHLWKPFNTILCFQYPVWLKYISIESG